MAIFALARPKYSVIEQIQRVVEVRLLKAVAVQNLQGVEDPPDRETWRQVAEMLPNINSRKQTNTLPPVIPTCCGLLTLVKGPPELHRLAALLHLLLNLPQLCPNLGRKKSGSIDPD